VLMRSVGGAMLLAGACRAQFHPLDEGRHGRMGQPPESVTGPGSETNAKRVTVVTKYNNVPQVTLVAIRTASQ